MCRFIETIRIDGGKAANLCGHNRRMNETRAFHWPGCCPLDLSDFLCLSPDMDGVRCRVVYDGGGIGEITYAPYAMREVRSLRLVEADVNYRFKSADRRELDCLFAARGCRDDVLIVRQGLLTDTTIANIALFDGTGWYTPQHPLLRGTRRESLLAQGILAEREIKREDLPSFSRLRLFNAMIGWGDLELPVSMVGEEAFSYSGTADIGADGS